MMSSAKETILALLEDIRPLLKQGGKEILLLEVTPDRARFRLEGFCSGCGCGASYRDGIREMLTKKIPDFIVEFE